MTDENKQISEDEINNMLREKYGGKGFFSGIVAIFNLLLIFLLKIMKASKEAKEDKVRKGHEEAALSSPPPEGYNKK